MSENTYPLTKGMAVATAAYAVYALVKPSHLSGALQESGDAAAATHRMAYTYAVRDLSTSALAFVPGLAPVAAALRISGDAGDATILGATAPAEARAKLIAVPAAWGVLNALALLVDRRG